jgi:branched-chain amino acid transport system substrate-binding protein
LIFLTPAGAECRDKIVLGVATSLTTIEGRDSLRAVQLAAEEINNKGGVRVGERRLKVAVESVDLWDASPATPLDVVLSTLENFVDEQRVDAIVVGFFRSEALLEGMDLIARKKIPLLGTLAMSPASEAKILRFQDYRYVFRLCLNSRYLVEYLIRSMKFLKERFNLRKVYILNQDVAWARTTTSLMIKLYFEREGWDVVGLDVYPTGISNFTESLARAKERGAELILPIFDMPESGALIREWHRMGSEALICGFISPTVGPGAWEAFEGRIAGALCVVFELGNVPSQRHAPAGRFYEAYRKRFKRPIEAGHGPAPAYDGVYVLADAIERAGTVEPDAVVRELERTDRQGVMGRVRFHEGHQVVFGEDPQEAALACIIQWNGEGHRHIVYPPSIAEAEVTHPSFLSKEP